MIQANESLVYNGDFGESLRGWTRGAENPRGVSVKLDTYEGEQIRYLMAVHQGSASQIIDVAKSQREDVYYTLSFLCENTAALVGTLSVSVEGDTGREQTIELTPTAQRNSPLDFIPESYDVRLTLPLEQADRIRLAIFSPENPPNDEVSGIKITRIRIDLHLGPLELQGLMLDEQQLPAARPLYLCLGASASLAHRFSCTPVADNPWLDTKAALVSDDNPQGAIIAQPAMGVNHPLDDQWILDCPLIEGDEPHLFTLNLINRYTADTYPIQASLGHHRLVFRERLEPAYFPVLEYGQSVRVGVQVASYYTGQALGGRTVNWGLSGQSRTTAVVTDDEGWAYFEVQSTLVGAGVFVLEASVQSPYYAGGVVTEEMQVHVLATDPWKTVLAVVEGTSTLWPEKTGYPNRGSTYHLGLGLPADSPLHGTEVALRWEGDFSYEQLGVQVQPELEEPVPVGAADLSWDLICADRLDGRFQLQLVCSKLLLPSEKKPMSLARNQVRIGEVQEANKVAVLDEGDSVLLRVQVLHELNGGPGDPVNNALADWITPDGTIPTVTGAGGWASVLYRPTRAGDQVVTARVRAHAEAVAVDHSFDVEALATSPWKNQVVITLDNVAVDLVELGLLCRRGAVHTLKVLPMASSSLLNQPVTLNWRGVPLSIGLTISDIGTPRTLGAQGLEWTFSSQQASSFSRLFTLQLSSPVLQSPRDLVGRLIASDLADELSVMLDQVAATPGDTLFPCLRAEHAFRLLPNALSPLTGLDVELDWQGTPVDELHASIEPPLGIVQRLSDGGVSWALDFTSSSIDGEFSLALQLPRLAGITTANPMHLGHNKLRIVAHREAAVDPVIEQDTAWQWVKVVSAFSGQPVAQAEVMWTAQGQSLVVASDEHGWSGYAFAPARAGDHPIEACVLSRFDGYEEQRSVSVTALASDPWAGVLVRFDGRAAQPWGGQTYFPRRKGEHLIEVLAEQGNPLLDRQLTLGLTGTGPSALGLSFQGPGLGVPRWFSSVGLQYTFKCGDLKDGGFALRLAAERLANLSPANAMSLGVGSQVLDISASANVHQVLDWEEELVEQVTVLSTTTGKTIVGEMVTWYHADLGRVTSQTDFYGVARIRFRPRTPGASVLIATVGDELRSVSVSLPFTVNEPRKIQALVSPQSSGYPGKEVSATATVVSARTGEPLSGVEVMWEYTGVSLAPTMTNADGVATVLFKLPMKSDALMASVRGGVGGWDVAQLLITVLADEPVLEDINSDTPTIRLGDDVIAWVKVVGRNGGVEMENVEVTWRFPDQVLLPSSSDKNGIASVTFKPDKLGTYDLTATLESSNPSSVARVTIMEAWHVEITELTPSGGYYYLIGGYPTVRAIVASKFTQQPAQGIEVFWFRNGNSAAPATHTNLDGLTSKNFGPLAAGVTRIRAQVRDPQGNVLSEKYCDLIAMNRPWPVNQ
ncbi:hypothetical protein [Pseudomonas sp. GM79]|uniref:hypothetical protein n=1 Tax=Pseudomonas sp. GM79 TaxID=1144338 RepID=UPI0012F9B8E4|nr:hypothetical protein [Pseudomonas sp. GM79]